MKRRIFCAVMTVVLVLTMLPVIAAAEGAVEIAFTQRETKAGATQVQVGVDMNNNPGLVTATIPVTWDNDVLHLVDVIPSEDILSAGWIGMSMDEYQSNGTYYLAWDNDLAEADFTKAEGCLAELVFDIVDPSKDTNTTLAFDMDDPIANVMNFDMEDLRETVTVNAANGTVSVAAEAGGDDPVVPEGAYAYITNADGETDFEVMRGEAFDLYVNIADSDPARALNINSFTYESEYISVDSMEWLLTGSVMSDIGTDPVIAFSSAVDVNKAVMVLHCTAQKFEAEVVTTTVGCSVYGQYPTDTPVLETVEIEVVPGEFQVRSYTPSKLSFTMDGAAEFEVQCGEEFVIDLILSESSALRGISLDSFEYSEDVFTIDSMEWVLPDAVMSSVDGDNPVIAFSSAVDANTTIMKLYCTAATFTEESKTTSISCNAIINVDDLNQNVDEIAADVKVTSYIRGDHNGDKYVTIDDAIYLLRNTFNSNGYPLKGGPADYNSDGYVTIDDAIYLLRHTFNPSGYPLA